MNHIKDKRLWWAANYGRGHVPAPLTPMTGIGLGIGLVGLMGLILMTMAFMAMFSPAIAGVSGGVSLAFVTFVSLPGRNAKGIKELQQVKGELKKAAVALLDAADGRDMTAEEQTRYDGFKADIARADTLIKREEERIELERETAGRAFDERGGLQAVHERADDDPKPFRDHRDFLTAVMETASGKRTDRRLQKFQASQYQATQGTDEQSLLSDPHGGFLVPVSVMPGILSVTAEQDPLDGLVTKIPMQTPAVNINARVDKDHSSSVSGGLTVTRRPELVDGSSSRMQFEQVEMVARELFGYCFASETILSDSPQSFLAILQAGFSDEFANNAINERLNGAGNGQFTGVIAAPCTVSVGKETGQAAASIATENIDKMAARCWRYGQAVWLANHNTRPQLKGLVRAVGTGGSVVPYFVTSPEGKESLDGRPIFFTEWCKTVGTVGDLVLGNWSEFLQGEYQPIMQAESIHVRFIANERAFKFWKRNAGQPWWKSALTPKNGSTLSPFVTLATRA